MTTTRHAKVRFQQRCIPPLVVDWLLAYGRRTSSYGAVRVSFDRQSRRELSRDVGRPIINQLSRFFDASLIVDSETDRVITAMWNR